MVASMHERKALMAELSDGFIAMPGGFGTFEELCEVITWTQLGLHRKRCGLLNVAGFFDPLIRLFDHAAAEGFIKPSNLEVVSSHPSPAALVDASPGPPVGRGAEMDPRPRGDMRRPEDSAQKRPPVSAKNGANEPYPPGSRGTGLAQPGDRNAVKAIR